MDKELGKGTRGLAADKFIVGESGKIRGTGKGKLPPEGLPRDLSDPKRALLSVCRGGGRFPPTETAPFQGYARRQRPTTWPTSAKRVPSNYNPKLTLPWCVLFRYTGDHFFDNHGFFCFIPSLGAWHKYRYYHQVTPGGQNDNPLLETVARAQGQTS